MKKVLTDPMPSRSGFERRASAILAERPKALLPEHASKVIAINVDTGELPAGPFKWRSLAGVSQPLARHAWLRVSCGWRTGGQVPRKIAVMTPTSQIEVVGSRQSIELTAI